MSGSGLEALAPVLRADQRAFLARGGNPELIHQPGGASLAEPFPMPVPSPDDPVHPARVGGDPVVETFVVAADGTSTPTGADGAVGAWWQPTVDALVSRTLAALTTAGIELEFPAYLSASATPVEQVATGPHFDDDQPRLDDGVGVVAIAASHGGPRLLVEPMPTPVVRPPVPLVAAPASVSLFDQAESPLVQRAPSDRIVIFPRFGQLHSGPRLDPGALGPGHIDPDGVRNLLVFRAATHPHSPKLRP